MTTHSRTITLIDYGAGNVPSVERALQKLGAETTRAHSSEQIESATALILPGVGHFAALIRALDEHNLRSPLLATFERGVPFLGICLGLQALYDGSEEAPDLPGLAIVPGQIVALPTNVKLPHMGWNQLEVKPRATPSQLLRAIPSDAHFYFAHSYAALPSQQKAGTVATCTHGSEFVAVFERNNIHAVQFHPEKSGTPGAQLLQNFLALAA
ncbi:MAG TPA: imidazole glycerol phosphate synthase subunit HisH [Candidatus Sulfotelmatobacter sp.]|nr:imidazole glycerol phosphate synthase subunit HisH [Candidatus Sulfotelmatobacter sp.]